MSNLDSPIMIDVAGVHKRFHYWSERPASLKSMLVDIAHGKINLGKKVKFSALEDVSFQIRKGEFVGIMGRNGAGKSTLLKLISGIYTPSEGQIHVHAPLAPLIELGAGFAPDLSGYENIFLNAAILGFGRAVTLRAVPQILEFAELGEKIYMPVKNYSSGMLVRLGFSIATHLTAPIILIDEVLAVGDVGFQQKSLRKIEELHTEDRTIVLITHDPSAVAKHCNRCIVIDQTHKIFDGPAQEGVDVYMRAVHASGG
jgi:ABC-type polysaccharide/polyol phosphate transport system ATPase subunit